jgi:hypothetical protein
MKFDFEFIFYPSSSVGIRGFKLRDKKTRRALHSGVWYRNEVARRAAWRRNRGG